MKPLKLDVLLEEFKYHDDRTPQQRHDDRVARVDRATDKQLRKTGRTVASRAHEFDRYRARNRIPQDDEAFKAREDKFLRQVTRRGNAIRDRAARIKSKLSRRLGAENAKAAEVEKAKDQGYGTVFRP